MAGKKGSDGERELISPNGDNRYQRRNDDGSFAESDDQSRSLRADVRQHSGRQKPKNQGDKGDEQKSD